MKSELTDRDLAERLAALPREIPPLRDPWAQINDRISGETDSRIRADGTSPPTHRKPWVRYLGAMAASLALAFVAGWILGQREPGPAAPGLVAEPSSENGSWQALLASYEAEYGAALDEFNQVGDARSGLPAHTVFEIEKGWAILEATEKSLQKALENNPDDPFLISRLIDLRSRQLDLLRQLAELDQMQRRSSI